MSGLNFPWTTPSLNTGSILSNLGFARQLNNWSALSPTSIYNLGTGLGLDNSFSGSDETYWNNGGRWGQDNWFGGGSLGGWGGGFGGWGGGLGGWGGGFGGWGGGLGGWGGGFGNNDLLLRILLWRLFGAGGGGGVSPWPGLGVSSQQMWAELPKSYNSFTGTYGVNENGFRSFILQKVGFGNGNNPTAIQQFLATYSFLGVSYDDVLRHRLAVPAGSLAPTNDLADALALAIIEKADRSPRVPDLPPPPDGIITQQEFFRAFPIGRISPVGGSTLTPGIWGTDGFNLNVTATGATINTNGGPGTINMPIVPDRFGRFSVRGTLTTSSGGPTRPGDSHRAQFTGQVVGNVIREITVTLDNGRTFTLYNLVYGRAGNIFPIL